METKQLDNNPSLRAVITGGVTGAIFMGAFVLILILNKSEDRFSYALPVLIAGIILETMIVLKGIFFVRCPVCGEKMKNRSRKVGSFNQLVDYECRICQIIWRNPGFKLDEKIELNDD